MVTNITIINKIMNEYLLKYLQQGYIINTQTMHGSQSDCPFKVDLSRGKEFVRIYAKREGAYWDKDEVIKELRRKYDYDNDIYIVAVAYKLFDNKSSFARNDSTVWMDKLEIIESRYIYEIGWRRNLGYTENLEEVKRACEIQNNRDNYYYSCYDREKIYTDIEHLRIGLRVVKKQPRTKSIHLENIDSVHKYEDGHYRVFYTTNSGKSDSVRIR